MIIRRTLGALRNIIIVSLVVTVTLFIADRAIAVVRGPIVKPVNQLGMETGFNPSGTRLRPGFDSTYRNAEFAIHIRINSHGLRGPEHSYERPPGTIRILALGDSFTFGQGVEYDQAWPWLLAATADGPARVESINAGWASPSQSGQLEYLRRFGLRYDPDLVIAMIFVGNNVVNELAAERAGEGGLQDVELFAGYLTNYQVRVGPLGAVRQAVDELLPNLYEITTLALVKLQYGLGSRRATFDYILADDEPAEIRHGWERLLAAVEGIVRATEAAGKRAAVVVAPFYDQVTVTRYPLGYTPDRPQRILIRFCAQRALECLDLRPALVAAGDPADLYYVKDGHWTPRGHDVVAKAIRDWLQARDLWPARAGD